MVSEQMRIWKKAGSIQPCAQSKTTKDVRTAGNPAGIHID